MTEQMCPRAVQSVAKDNFQLDSCQGFVLSQPAYNRWLLLFSHRLIAVKDQPDALDQGFHHGTQVALYDLIELVQGKVDAMVGNAPLRKVVGPDALGSIAGTTNWRLLAACSSCCLVRAASRGEL